MSAVSPNPPPAPSRQDEILAHFESVTLEVRIDFKYKSYSDRWFPSGRVYQVDQLSRQLFLEMGTFSTFVRRVALCMSKMTSKDLETVGFPGHESENAKEYLDVLDTLHAAGFYRPKNQAQFFWSGTKARKALDVAISPDEPHLGDESFTGLDMLYDLSLRVLALESQAGRPLVGELLRETYAASFASSARGEALCVTSNDKPCESQKSLTVHNFFWNAELPVLQRLRLQGLVTKITLIYWDVQTKGWKRCDLNDPQTGGTFRLYRRLGHKMDKHLESFYQERTLPDGTLSCGYDPTFPARPSITLNTLRKITTHWRHFKRKKPPASAPKSE